MKHEATRSRMLNLRQEENISHIDNADDQIVLEEDQDDEEESKDQKF